VRGDYDRGIASLRMTDKREEFGVASIKEFGGMTVTGFWIPASAGMTEKME